MEEVEDVRQLQQELKVEGFVELEDQEDVG